MSSVAGKDMHDPPRILIVDDTVSRSAEQLAALAARHALPAIYPLREYTLFRRTAHLQHMFLVVKGTYVHAGAGLRRRARGCAQETFL